MFILVPFIWLFYTKIFAKLILTCINPKRKSIWQTGAERSLLEWPPNQQGGQIKVHLSVFCL